MSTENLRNLSGPLKAALRQNVPFIYAHVVKFERPKSVSQYLGESVKVAEDFAYITDGNRDIIFDDGSGLGPQIYRANKVLKLSTTNETIKAKASNMTLTLDSVALSAIVSNPVITVASGVSIGSSGSLTTTGSKFTEAGFREGDKVTLNLGAAVYNVRLDTFISNGTGFNFTAIDTIPEISGVTYDSIDMSSEELNALTISKTATEYSSYINRSIEIHKVFIAVEDTALDTDNNGSFETSVASGAVLGSFLQFKGMISKATLTDGPKSSTIEWTAASHWADFSRVQGRRTEDSSHRGVDSDGLPDRNATVKPEYADDLGFLHSTRAVNLTAVYNRTEYKTVVEEDKTFGVVTGVDTKEVPYDVPTELDLRFNMQAKYLPIVYGVQRVDTIPIFADTRANKSTEVHVLYAIAEGRVTGLYDLQLNGHSSICMDPQDHAVRGTRQVAEDADGEVDFVCKGYQNYGNTLIGYDATTGQSSSFTSSSVGQSSYITSASATGAMPQVDQFTPVVYSQQELAVGNKGILHELTHSFDSPVDAHLTFHSGKAYQKANNRMVAIAQSASASSRFKVQNDYYTDKETYWGPNHRLLDTAYLHSQFEISQGETEVPKFKAVLNGVAVECFNYDHSHATDIGYSASDSTNLKAFQIGDTVTLHHSASNSEITTSGNWHIHDRWFFYDAEGNKNYRFIIKNDAGEVPTISSTTRFYIKSGTDKLHYAGYATKEAISKNVGAALEATISARGAQTITLNSPSSDVEAALGLNNPTVKLLSSKNASFIHGNFSGFSYEDPDANKLTNLGATITWGSDITKVILGNAIKLDSTLASNNNKFNGARITVTRTFDDGNTYVQKRVITDYDGATRVAIVDSPWDGSYIPGYDEPGTPDTYIIEVAIDERSTTNPSMQLLDYLRSERYGKGLKLSEVDIPSFVTSARECDTKSDISVVATATAASAVVAGQKYSFGTPGTSGYFRGTVAVNGIGPAIDIGGTDYKQITFTNIIGKLGKKFNKYTNYVSGELIWEGGYAKTASSGYMTGGFGGSNGALTTVTLARHGGGTGLVIDVSIFRAGNQNPIVKGFSSNFNTFSGSGYSLYDSDDIKYWKYIGWDYPDQRYVTRHQMNQSINTSQPLFTTVNKMLEQFNGMLRYSVGKYSLAVKSKEPATFDSLELFNEGDIIGPVKITDAGSKKTYNSANLSFPDPQNKFENREISFFDSNFLKEDKGIPRNLSYQARGITNYFNARFNIVQKIKESRFGLNINFKVGPRGLALLPGEIIQLTYPSFGFTNKRFRITTLNFTADCLVSITAREHNESAYIVDNVQEDVVGGTFELGGLPIREVPAAPLALSATSNSPGGITLIWQHSPSFSPLTHKAELWRASSNSRSNTTTITANSTNPTTSTTQIVVTSASGIAVGDLVSYRNSPAGLKVANGGVNGTTITLDKAVQIPLNLEGSAVDTVPEITTSEVDAVGTPESIPSKTELTFFKAEKIHTTNGDETEYTDAVISNSNTVTRYYWIRYVVRSQELSSGAIKITEKFSPFFPASATGGIEATSQPAAAPRAVKLSIGGANQTGNVITYDEDSANPNPASVTITATPENTAGTVNYLFQQSTDGSSFSDVGVASTSSQITFNAPAALSSLPVIIKVVMTDAITNGPTYTSSDTASIIGTRTVNQLLNSSLNLAGQYSTLGGLTTDAFSGIVRGSIALETGVGNFLSGGQSLALTATAGDSYVYLRPDNESGGLAALNIPITPGKKWILSFFAKLSPTNSPSTANGNVEGFINYNSSASATGHVSISGRVPDTTNWHRVEGVIDLTSATDNRNTATKISIRVDNNSFNSSGNTTMYFDNFQLEEQITTGDSAKPFTPASNGAFTVIPSLSAFNFGAGVTGAVSGVSGYQCTFIVKRDALDYTFDNTTSSATGFPTDTFRFGSITTSQSDYGSGNTNDIALSIASNGIISVNSSLSSSPFLGANSVDSCFANVPVIDNNTGLPIATIRLSFTKATTGQPGRTVTLTATQQIIEYSAAGAHGGGNITLNAAASNFSSPEYKFTGGGSAFSDQGSFSGSDSATFAIPTTYSATPYTFTVEVRESATGSSNQTDKLTIASIKPGTNGSSGGAGAAGANAFTIVLSNESHTVSAGSDGTVTSLTGSGTTVRVFEGTTELNSVSVTPGANQFKVTASGTNITPGTVSVLGNPATVANHSNFLTGSDNATVDLSINIENALTVSRTQSLSKSKAGTDGSGGTGTRGGIDFVFDTTNANISVDDVSRWTETTTFTAAAAQAAATAVVAAASDDVLRPNDKITLVDTANNRAAQRIYEGTSVIATAQVSSLGTGDFSSKVVGAIDGSAVISGTLSADRLQANSTFTSNLTVGSDLILGTSSVNGKIYSFGKVDGNGDPQTNVAGVYLDKTSFQIGGAASGGTTVFTNDGIKVTDAGGTVRVKIGNLSNL